MSASEAFKVALQALKKGELARIAEETGISIGELSRYRSAKSTGNPTINTFAVIAKAMRRSADELLGLTPPVDDEFRAELSRANARLLAAEKHLRKARAAAKLLAEIVSDESERKALK